MIKKLKSLSILAVSLMFLASCGNQPETTESTAVETDTETTAPDAIAQAVDLSESNVQWKGEMMGMYSHEGNIDLTQAELLMADGEIAGGSFTVDMTTMVPTDKNYDAAKGNTAEKLVGHLSSADFFDVDNHPTASFEITSISDNTATGTLTVRGKTGVEKVENIAMNEDGTVTGSLVFNRTNYDVSFKHPLQEMVLSDNINLNIILKLKS